MRINSGAAAIRLGLVAVLAIALAVGVWQPTLEAFAPAQAGNDPIIVTEKGCDFDLDNNGDGQPDQPFEPAAGGYLPQDTMVIVHCWFQATTVADAEIQLESGLEGWSAIAEITRETEDYSRDVDLNSGESDIVVQAGGYHVNLNMSGRTQRGSAREEIANGYWHDLQVPSLFRLVDIAITTDARDKEVVVSETVSSASTAYIRAHNAVSKSENDPESALPKSVLDLAKKLLDEGYPRMAERVVDLEFQTAGSEESGRGLPTWSYVVIAVVVVVLLTAIGVVIWWIRRPPTLPDDDD